MVSSMTVGRKFQAIEETLGVFSEETDVALTDAYSSFIEYVNGMDRKVRDLETKVRKLENDGDYDKLRAIDAERAMDEQYNKRLLLDARVAELEEQVRILNVLV